ncbi:MAG: hypothetical protein ACKPKO_18655, partial [Candidatus Fonsibacter sp.]
YQGADANCDWQLTRCASELQRCGSALPPSPKTAPRRRLGLADCAPPHPASANQSQPLAENVAADQSQPLADHDK